MSFLVLGREALLAKATAAGVLCDFPPMYLFNSTRFISFTFSSGTHHKSPFHSFDELGWLTDIYT